MIEMQDGYSPDTARSSSTPLPAVGRGWCRGRRYKGKREDVAADAHDVGDRRPPPGSRTLNLTISPTR
ncbi:hypothetical protein P0O24_04495 [Methanotrichaceae archaeon M04Ac]|uniref:Uncharacterized protein n=1 Tax=Candidatus Methanocrinis alkalitolerans TaxID=3033395 RepID=A0ABT5XDQ1_9EURY|nr:hypothetical protein [Candidatus Methanocrinis alkalitolerans]MDF0592838.1 hypothetical protein [Candidatus Methanocrinis alkalitolerans]